MPVYIGHKFMEPPFLSERKGESSINGKSEKFGTVWVFPIANHSS